MVGQVIETEPEILALMDAARDVNIPQHWRDVLRVSCTRDAKQEAINARRIAGLIEGRVKATERSMDKWAIKKPEQT